MNGLLFYFSGTGNTKWAADKFKEKFSNKSCALELINIENSSFDPKILNSCDFIIFGFPIHAESAPRIFIDFLKKLPCAEVLKNRDMKCMIFCTLAATNAAGLSIVSKALAKKGFNVSIELALSFWSNYFFAVGEEKSKTDMDEILKNVENTIDSSVTMFLAGEQKLSPVSKMRKSSAIIVEKLYHAFLPLLSKDLTSTNDCVKCGLCVKKCPKHNITLNDTHAVFGKKCMVCVRCIHLCPANAIRYKGKKINQVQKEFIKRS